VKSINFLGFSEKLSKGFFFHFTSGMRRGKFVFTSIASIATVGKVCFQIVVLTTDEKPYMWVCRVYMLFVCYMCPICLSDAFFRPRCQRITLTLLPLSSVPLHVSFVFLHMFFGPTSFHISPRSTVLHVFMFRKWTCQCSLFWLNDFKLCCCPADSKAEPPNHKTWYYPLA